MSRPECRMDGCAKQSAGRGLCSTHWRRWRTHGDPNIVKVNGVDFNTKTSCTLDDCGRVAHAHGYCTMHLRRWEKHGDPRIIGERNGRPLKGDAPTHSAIHQRLSRERGSARLRQCVDCGGNAREWSYDGRDENATQTPQGPYSTDLTHYEPRCVRCHRKFDASWTKRPRTAAGTFGAKGEPTTTGVDVFIRHARETEHADV